MVNLGRLTSHQATREHNLTDVKRRLAGVYHGKPCQVNLVRLYTAKKGWDNPSNQPGVCEWVNTRGSRASWVSGFLVVLCQEAHPKLPTSSRSCACNSWPRSLTTRRPHVLQTDLRVFFLFSLAHPSPPWNFIGFCRGFAFWMMFRSSLEPIVEFSVLSVHLRVAVF